MQGAEKKQLQDTCLEKSTIEPLALKLAKQKESFVKFYQEVYKFDRAKAENEVRDFIEFSRTQLLEGAPDQITWLDLSFENMDEADAEIVEIGWNRLHKFADHELESGLRAAAQVEGGYDHSPLDCARFLSIRRALRREWKPCHGSESALVDMLAQIEFAWGYWLHRHMKHVQTQFDRMTRIEKDARQAGAELPPRVSDVETMEFSAEMCDRFNKMYLRTLRALRDLKRMAPNIVVQNAEQVNVGENQINLKQGTAAKSEGSAVGQHAVT